MSKKKILIIASILCIAGYGIFELFSNKEENTNTNNEVSVEYKNTSTTKKIKTDKKSNDKPNKIQSSSNNKESKTKKQDNKLIKETNLYKETSSSVIPLSAITELSGLPASIRNTVDIITRTNNIYMVQRHNDKIFIISDNHENIRHGIDFVEISLVNGQHTQTTLGYSDKMKDSDNDIWEYNSDTKLPTRHTKYNKDGDMEFVEVWNYDDNPVKYEMKDSDGKVLSMRKETQHGGTDLRVEHLIYDKNGNTRINVSATYDGEDIKRFTYYNADKPAESGSIFSEYTDGNKTKETVYTSDLKVKNTYTSEYKDGLREEITKFDNKNREVNKYIQNDNL